LHERDLSRGVEGLQMTVDEFLDHWLKTAVKPRVWKASECEQPGLRALQANLEEGRLPNIRLYDLRHTAATLALTVGVSPKVVSEQRGHTSAAFTLDVYSHVLAHMQDDAAAKVEAALLA
jgi:integrase